jgi:hypothetical protein
MPVNANEERRGHRRLNRQMGESRERRKHDPTAPISAPTPNAIGNSQARSGIEI